MALVGRSRWPDCRQMREKGKGKGGYWTKDRAFSWDPAQKMQAKWMVAKEVIDGT